MKKIALILSFLPLLLNMISCNKENDKIDNTLNDSPVNPIESTTTDWPTFHGNNGNWSYSTSIVPKTQPSLKWSKDICGPTDGDFCEPIVADGVIIIIDEKFVKAFNFETGETLWTINSYGFLSGGVIENGILIFARELVYYGVNLHTGKEIWSYKLNKEVYADVVWSNPKIENNKLIFTYGNSLYSLDINTGIENWVIKFTIPVGHSTPSISDGIAYFSGKDLNSGISKIYAVDLNTKNVVWTLNGLGGNSSFGTELSNLVIIVGDNLLFSVYSTIYCLNKKTLDIKWQKYNDYSIIDNKSPAFNINTMIYFNNSIIYKIDLNSGEILQQRYHTSTIVYPSISNDKIIGYKEEAVTAWDLESLEIIWSIVGGLGDENKPVIANGKVIVITYSNITTLSHLNVY